MVVTTVMLGVRGATSTLAMSYNGQSATIQNYSAPKSGMHWADKPCPTVVVTTAFLFAEKGSQSLNVPLGLRNSGIGYQVTLLNLKSPDLECGVLEQARSRMSHWIHFEFLPPTDPSFAGAPEGIASELAPMEA